jgi:hypothetical protein
MLIAPGSADGAQQENPVLNVEAIAATVKRIDTKARRKAFGDERLYRREFRKLAMAHLQNAEPVHARTFLRAVPVELEHSLMEWFLAGRPAS